MWCSPLWTFKLAPRGRNRGQRTSCSICTSASRNRNARPLRHQVVAVIVGYVCCARYYQHGGGHGSNGDEGSEFLVFRERREHRGEDSRAEKRRRIRRIAANGQGTRGSPVLLSSRPTKNVGRERKSGLSSVVGLCVKACLQK